MLTRLAIRNLAIVDTLDLEFEAGMSVITGETGAGKSILLDALGFVLGDRARPDLIRAGAERMEVHAEFELSDETPARAWLAEREIGYDGSCMLRRALGSDGRSRGWINGLPANAGDLRALGELLLDIHGQHAHQSLMRADSHLQLIDAFGQLGNQVSTLNQQVREWQALNNRLTTLRDQGAEASAQRELLHYQVSELENIAPVDGEVEALETEFRRLSQADETQVSGQRALGLMHDDEHGALSQLQAASSMLGSISDQHPRLESARDCVASAIVQCEEGCSELQGYLDSVEGDPQRQQQIESRLDELYTVARKHHLQAPELPALMARLQQQLAELEGSDADIEALTRQADDITALYQDGATRLGESRRASAQRLEAIVEERIQQLGMGKARFFTELKIPEPGQPQVDGGQRACFQIAVNPGQDPAPLHKVASGGELSRIGLAICVASAELASHDCLIFDEVDTGIGGATAEIVGRYLRELGSRSQVFCITHLPQVAAQAHHHYEVSKELRDADTLTTTRRLQGKEKVEELARMLGGVNIGKETLKHAKKMLEAAEGA